MSAFEKILKPENLTNSSEHYQVSQGTKIVYDHKTRHIVEFNINGKPLELDKMYKVGLQTYHFNNIEKFLGLPTVDVMKNGKPVILCSALTNVFEEFFMAHNNVKAKVEGRIQRINQ
jgi:hypothetical protein